MSKRLARIDRDDIAMPTNHPSLDRMNLEFPPLPRVQPIVENDGNAARGSTRTAENFEVAKPGTIRPCRNISHFFALDFTWVSSCSHCGLLTSCTFDVLAGCC
jgi:hypothetical protein